jgi:membrane protease YdiL (CAAX protease family)
MMNTLTTDATWPRKVLISIALLICGVLVFVFGTNYYSIFPTNDSQIYRGVLAGIFLVTALFLRRNESMEIYSHIAYAFFIGIVTYFVTSLTLGVRDSLLSTLGDPTHSPRYLAAGKVFEASLVILTILVLTAVWSRDLRSLYLKKGRLGLGLFIGICLLLINSATGVVTGAALGVPGEDLIRWLPWSLVYSLANGLMEELVFRGLFLRRFTSLIGVGGAIVVTSVTFTVMHSFATYMNPIEAILFQVIIFPMALLLGYLMYKTDSVWGSMLYHAGSDVFLFYLMTGEF